MEKNQIVLEESWKKLLKQEFQEDYMKNLKDFLTEEYKNQKRIYPKKKDYFRAFFLTPFNQVKVVILGQDPYHQERQACGLCFSVPKGVNIPPSLKNIFKELEDDLKIKSPLHGDLSLWAKQGVLLLNSILSVQDSRPGSHKDRGWERFTDRVLSLVSEKKENVVFVLWGAFAISKSHLLDSKKHLILKSPHPSPLSAHRGFFKSKPFSKINSFLEKNKKTSIDWKI